MSFPLTLSCGNHPIRDLTNSSYYQPRMKTALKLCLVFLILTILFTALRIYTYGNNSVDASADAAVVLGAAVWSSSPSPVFRERINHAIELYRRGKVRKLIFTEDREIPMSRLKQRQLGRMPWRTGFHFKTS
jgi:vancomycin permeability regulator SanA